MNNFVQFIFLTVVEGVVIFKWLEFPLNVLSIVGLNLLFIAIVGYVFSPRRSRTLRADFDKIAPYYDAVADAQKALAESLNDKTVASPKLEAFNSKLSNFEKAFPQPDQDFQDRSCREWFQASKVKFQLYSEVASTLVGAGGGAQGDSALLLQKLKAASEIQKSKSELVGLRVSSLKKSAVYSMFVGFLTWLLASLKS